eukprot:COSAG04_NODE_29302_length_270_cov_0.590643_1_plen_62_part_10
MSQFSPHLGVDLLGRGWLAGVTAAVCCVMSPLIQRHECSCTCTRYRRRRRRAARFILRTCCY